ncbi:MAG: 1-acyl-sn-glycerol-3-phosphate acyltransferase [Clostridia bacterium]|nr:1-acyl-sn-glycerol-3-phosphate acyltransferase [Clostridia bacterium]
MKNKKQKKWIKPRHRLARNLICLFLSPYSRIKYGLSIEPYREQKKGQPYLILFNHQTAFDQFFVGMAFKGPVYYVASEDIFSMGWISKLIRFLVAPIPIKKQTTDVHAVMTCRRVAKEGGTIALAPEGNRTYSGKTEHMNPAVVGLIRLLKLPLILYKLEGGYGVHPRWSDHVRKGKMRAYVSRVVQPDEYASMSDEELLSLVQKELYVNEGTLNGTFKHKRLAEGLERAMYVCPDCGITKFKTNRDVIECCSCGKKVRYLPTKELVGVNGVFPFRFTTEWYDYQSDFVRRLDLERFNDTPICSENGITMSEVILYKKKKTLQKNVTLSIFNGRFEIDFDKSKETLPFERLSAVTVLGKNKLNLYFDKKVWQFKGDKSMNALKFANLFYHYKNVQAGDPHGQFLGL